jgi:tetratricopeptide (TPR) repeat protein
LIYNGWEFETSKSGDSSFVVAWLPQDQVAPPEIASKQFKAQAASKPNDAASQMAVALSCWPGGDPHCMEACNRAVALAPRNMRYLAIRGGIWRSVGSEQKAVDDFSKALEQDPAAVHLLQQRACAQLQLGQADLAVADCDTAIALKPSLALLWLTRGFCRREQGELQAALSDFEEARSRQMTPYDVFLYHLWRAQALIDLSQRALAMEDINETIAMLESPLDEFSLPCTFPATLSEKATAFAVRADLNFNEGRMDEALRDCGSALVAHPGETRARNIRGLVFIKRNEFAAAINEYNIALAIQPEWYALYVSRGAALVKTNQLDEAIKDFSWVIDNSPDLALKALTLGNRSAVFRARGEIRAADEDQMLRESVLEQISDSSNR